MSGAAATASRRWHLQRWWAQRAGGPRPSASVRPPSSPARGDDGAMGTGAQGLRGGQPGREAQSCHIVGAPRPQLRARGRAVRQRHMGCGGARTRATAFLGLLPCRLGHCVISGRFADLRHDEAVKQGRGASLPGLLGAPGVAPDAVLTAQGAPAVGDTCLQADATPMLRGSRTRGEHPRFTPECARQGASLFRAHGATAAGPLGRRPHGQGCGQRPPVWVASLVSVVQAVGGEQARASGLPPRVPHQHPQAPRPGTHGILLTPGRDLLVDVLAFPGTLEDALSRARPLL